MDGNTVIEGDRVRLKFLYPNGAIEILDGTWLSATTLGAPENPSGGWVVVSVNDRVLWKPLSHLVQFEVVNRQAFDTATGQPVGVPRPPEPWESGTKDTLVVYPGEIARLKAHFDLRGRYVWHCHILSHEDNEMMRPVEVVG